MTDYSSADDNSLLSLSSKGDREAEEELIRRYTKLVRLSARRFFLLGGELHVMLLTGETDGMELSYIIFGKLLNKSGLLGIEHRIGAVEVILIIHKEVAVLLKPDLLASELAGNGEHLRLIGIGDGKSAVIGSAGGRREREGQSESCNNRLFYHLK